MVVPIANIHFPSEEKRSQIVGAVTSLAAGLGAVVTATIPVDYPPIDRTIQNPVIAALFVQDGAAQAANGCHAFDITGHCNGVPDSAGEFQITGERTIDFWQLPNETGHILIIYVSKGSGDQW